MVATAVLHQPSAQRTNTEIELKLELDPADVDLVPALPLVRGAEPRSAEQLTVYYDTKSGVIRDRGHSLRVRSAGDRFVQTVKPLAHSVGLMGREETECPVPSIEPEPGRVEHLLGLLASQDLVPVTRSQVTRTSWIVRQGGSEIQVDLDDGRIEAGNGAQRFAELELELLDGQPAALLMAARAIAAELPCRLGVLTKAERGERLAAGAFDRVSKAGPVRIDRAMSVAAAFEVMVHACLKHYRLNEPLLIGIRKKEALHQTRVAMRRLRSAFTLFKTAIADVEYHYLREELRWFTNQLGDARNLDVYLERDLPDSQRDALTARREAAYDSVIAAMNSSRARTLMLELVGWTAFGPWRSARQGAKPVEPYARGRLDRLWKSIEPLGAHLAGLDELSRHELRIQVKKMRYAIEFLRGLYPDARPEEKRFAAAVEVLQESLGKLNDLATARTLATVGDSDDWLIGEPEERRHLRESEQAFRDLAAVGPFWRGAHHHHHYDEAAATD